MQLYTHFWGIRYVKNLRVQINILSTEQLGNWILIHPVGTAQKTSLEYCKCSDSISIQATAASRHILLSSIFSNHVLTSCFIQRPSRVNELSWPTLRHYPGICMEGLKKTGINLCQSSRLPDIRTRDLPNTNVICLVGHPFIWRYLI